jgi:hypothetical protein
MASPTRLSQASRVAPLRPSHDPVQFPARAADVDSCGHRGGEVAVRGVQPGQQRRLDPGGAQGEGLGDVGDAQPAGARAEGRAGHLDGAVPVGVGLDDGHDLRG